MNLQFLHIIFTGIRRRSKSFIKIFITAFLIAFFISGILIFQDNMNLYQREANYKTYGDWVFMYTSNKDIIPEVLLEHTFFDGYGQAYLGPVMLIEEGVTSGYAIGALDESFIDYGNISLIDGRFPETSSEIAMERRVLAKLGYNYELGQQISFYCKNINKELEYFTFTLCGVIDGYTSIWPMGSALPPALVSPDVLLEQTGYRNINTIFHLDAVYENIGSDALNETLEVLNGKTHKLRLKYNDLVYDAALWGADIHYNMIVFMIMMTGVFALFYMYVTHFNNRRPFYYRLREFGATKGQIRIVILSESLIPSIFSGVIGIAASIIAVRLLMLTLTSYFTLSPVFRLNPYILLIIVSAFLLTIIISNIAIIIMSGFKGLSENTGRLSLRQLSKIKKHCKKTLTGSNVISFISARQLKSANKRMLLSRLFALSISILLVLSADMISTAYKDYKDPLFFKYQMTCEQVSEDMGANYVFEYTKDNMPHSFSFGLQLYSLSDGFDAEFYEKIEALKGIKSMYKYSRDNYHIFDWEGKELSPVRKSILEYINQQCFGTEDLSVAPEGFYPEDGPLYRYLSNYVEDTGYYYKLLEQYIEKDTLSYEDFESGNKVILIIRSDVSETTLKVGDKIGIVTKSGTVYSEIGCIIDSLNSDYSDLIYSDFSHSAFTIVASHKFGQRVAESDGSTFNYNYINFNLNNFSEIESTDRMLASFFSEYGYDYHDFTAKFTERKATFHQTLSAYLPFFAMVLASFILISYNSIESKLISERESRLLFKNLGMSANLQKRLAFKNARKSVLISFLALPFSFLISCFWKSRDFIIDYLTGSIDRNIKYYWSVETANKAELAPGSTWALNKITNGFTNCPLVPDLISNLQWYKLWTTFTVILLVIISYIATFLILNRKFNKED